jgi:hypothetical protein
MCDILSNVSIGSGVTSIGNAAFNGCEKLESIYIPDNVTSIGDMAFQSCTELETITLGSGVESIGCGVFWNCVRLYDVYCKPITPPKIWDDTFYTVNLSGTYICGIGKIYVPQYSESIYKNAENWKSVASKIREYSFND